VAVARGHAAMSFSFARGSASRKVCIGVLGNRELLEKINAALATLAADGTLKSIFNKYGLDWAPPK
jgi:ABC-type amino acid transport substrate-binding protein